MRMPSCGAGIPARAPIATFPMKRPREGRGPSAGKNARATRGAAFALLLLAAPLLAQTRIASDFEMQQMERQVAQQHGFIAQLSGHLNLGDLWLSRNESALATAEYAKALAIAAHERTEARRASDMTRYADATSYAALAEAKLSHDARAFALAEESLRYESDSAKTWNLYANTMVALRQPRKAASAERNAVALATEPLDLAIYRYALASSLIELGERAEARRLLVDVVTSLKSNEFASLRSAVARQESFEVYSSVRGDAPAYVSLLNRSQLRLAALQEAEGDLAAARATYRDVLAGRTDDPTALAALSRLATSDEERARYFAAAFDANPFSLALIRDYQRQSVVVPPSSTTGGKVRQAIDEMKRGELRAARATLDALIAQFPDNDTLRTLRREAEGESTLPPFMTNPPKSAVRPTAAELRQIATAKNLDRAVLDALTFQSVVTFDKAESREQKAETVFESGSVEGVRFRFEEPIAFNGTFAANTPLWLTYRILGQTDTGLLIEPLKLEVIK